MSYEIKLDVFEGPLDLLLYLIRKNEIDIYNIPVALITSQYLGYLGEMRSLNLDLAGEYLVMAATLAHIKSRMLLPVTDEGGDEEEGEDPRAELVKQLLEYQVYKEAARLLSARPLLERDVFKLGAYPELLPDPEKMEMGLLEVDLFELVEAFRRIVAGLEVGEGLEFSTEKLSLAERINEIMEVLAKKGQISFSELVIDRTHRKMVVYTFLAILELIKLRMAKVRQAAPFGEIRLFLAVKEELETPKMLENAEV
ncbi:MAG: segregation/condensation protein A [Syntrophobacterales bacterium]|nr:segregation/condensation protein A [Syntrophobacterales bacterium]